MFSYVLVVYYHYCDNLFYFVRANISVMYGISFFDLALVTVYRFVSSCIESTYMYVVPAELNSIMIKVKTRSMTVR